MSPWGLEANGPVTRGEPREQHQIQPLFQFRLRRTAEVMGVRLVLGGAQHCRRFGGITGHLRLGVTDDAPAPGWRCSPDAAVETVRVAVAEADVCCVGVVLEPRLPFRA